jgi:hypothetical protein
METTIDNSILELDRIFNELQKFENSKNDVSGEFVKIEHEKN